MMVGCDNVVTLYEAEYEHVECGAVHTCCLINQYISATTFLCRNIAAFVCGCALLVHVGPSLPSVLSRTGTWWGKSIRNNKLVDSGGGGVLPYIVVCWVLVQGSRILCLSPHFSIGYLSPDCFSWRWAIF
ncbi:hypothetical protein B0I72DRAFT_138570 [Yarrowia lipolytica]|uniref:Uncharacterized protein n=1 Tax=Yarrowia lipolytica TaxID=4952 RepID=A0A371CB83_YARLL|nr:hypothetical protein B0I71DRAFT_128971 [Yarrowia lipolytica]RDW32152.1 hypothetical protein B0I72DRAFT_138570 [Yarrowia lipolytica]RDW42214.1 hypothetical protein B0I73DRAFT_127550 [Yarrowia lipolytica]RDW44490.1 hypothetical protein B0I74DRAFT_140382 [Yarrowia lipolytica]RDW51457.1 hypothetical protein B0I75DRAFT_139890 [Yarrowia lipolytica]